MAKIYRLDQLIRDEWNDGSGQSSGQSSGQLVQNPVSKHWIEIYPKKTKHYYRYVWREKGKLHHLHISGGNTTNPTAIALKRKVENAIATGMTPQEILLLIRSDKV